MGCGAPCKLLDLTVAKVKL